MEKYIFIPLLLFSFLASAQTISPIVRGIEQPTINPITYINVDDKEVQEFIAATGITDADTIAAIKYAVNTYKNSGIWGKRDFIYLLVGGSPRSHQYNLKDTSEYKLLYGTGVTHDGLGMVGDGTAQGYANTQYDPPYSNAMNMSFSAFAITDEFDGTVQAAFGTRDTATDKQMILAPSSSVLYDQSHYVRPASTSLAYPSTNTQGVFHLSFTDTNTSVFVDGMKTMYSTLDGDTVHGMKLYLLASRNALGNVSSQSDQKFAFFSGGVALTDDEVYTESQIVRTYNAMLNRYADSVYIGRPKSTYPLDLHLSATGYEPTKTYDADLAAWDALPNYSAMICWNTRSYDTRGDQAFNGYVGSPHIIDDTLHISEILDSLQTYGTELIYFTPLEAYGFSLEPLPDSIGMPQRLVDKFNAFVKQDAEMNPNIPNDIVEKFVNGCVARGIKPGFYFNTMRNLNLQPESGFGHVAFDSTDCEHFDNYLAKVIQFYLTKYSDVKHVWYDGWSGERYDNENKAPVNDFQLFYDVPKDIDTSIVVIMNEWCDTSNSSIYDDSTFIRYPYDVGSSEEYVMDNIGTKSDVQNADTTMEHYGVTYRIKKEFIVNIADSPSETFWYATGDEGTTVRPGSEVQSFYDRAIAVGAKCCIAVIPGRNGNVQSSQWDIWRNMSW